MVYYDHTNKKYFFCKDEIFLYFSLSMRKLKKITKINNKKYIVFSKDFLSCHSLILLYEKITKK
jgi:hypothetical protein